MDQRKSDAKYFEMFNKIASKGNYKRDEFYNGIFDKGAEYGMRKFKRKTLGCLGSRKTKSIDEMATIFTEIGMTDSVAEAKYILPGLKNFSSSYDSHILDIYPNKDNSEFRIGVGSLGM